MEFKRCSGILMPISSLPGGYGIGSMGKPAHDFVDFLAKAGQTIWQILPVGPTGYADSPYQSCSAFAGNPYFIDLDLLAADDLLTKKDYAAINWGGDATHVDYGTLYEKRFAVLRKAYANFLKKRPVPGYETPYPDDWYRFQFLSSDWLPDYCLYMAIKEANGMVDWQQWPRALRVREPEALAEFKAEHAGEIEFWAFLQYEFDRQWRALHAYAKEKGVAIMGDIPIYVAAASADAASSAAREATASAAARAIGTRSQLTDALVIHIVKRIERRIDAVMMVVPPVAGVIVVETVGLAHLGRHRLGKLTQDFLRNAQRHTHHQQLVPQHQIARDGFL